MILEIATHVAVIRDRRGALHKMETAADTGPVSTAVDLAHGGVPAGFTLARVERQDLAAGTLVDVTAEILHGVAAECDLTDEPCPEALYDAFERYGVPLPTTRTTIVWVDPNAEHRLTAAEMGVTLGRAA